MFKLTNAEVRPLTREFARDFRDLEPSPTERDILPSRIKHLRAKAEQGFLVTFHWSTAQLGNRVFRMNGQHSSAMLSELNGLFPENAKVHLDEYVVESELDLALLFRQFDDRKSGRSPADVSGAYQGLYEPLRGIPKEHAKLAIDGIAWWMKHVEGLPVGLGDDAYELFGRDNMHGFIQWLGLDVFSIKTPELKRVPVIGAIYATFANNENGSKIFWAEVARGGAEYEETAPSTALDGWLKKLREEKPNHKTEIKPGEYYQGCIFAWNAYRSGKVLKDGKINHDVSKGFHAVAE